MLVTSQIYWYWGRIYKMPELETNFNNKDDKLNFRECHKWNTKEKDWVRSNAEVEYK
jgi:hypothetical protein